MADISGILGDGWNKQKNIDPPEVQLADAMAAAGIDPPPNIKLDGQLHRFSTKGRKKDDSGWYVAFGDGVPAGRFGCWRDQIEQSWKADVGRELTASEQMAITRRTSEARAARDAARKRKNEIAASTVDKIWADAGAASKNHPYLKTKGVQPHGARITGDGRLMIPMMDQDGSLSSLQYISEGGDKKYHPGGAVKGCSWMLGDPDKTIFIAEGFATAATILEVTSQAVAVAFSAGNLPAVAQSIRKQHSLANIIIVADNDKSGVGKNYADQAAAKTGARIVMPPIEGDANDYRASGCDLNELLFPTTPEWSVDADDFSSQPAPIKWQIKHWLQADALIMMHGPSGGGKTFVVLDMVMHMAAGRAEWLGHKVTQGGVFYLAGEGHHGLKGRIAAWKQHHGIKTFDGNFRISKSGCDLNTPEGYQKLAEEIRNLPTTPAVIVVDTVHRNFYGDENSAQDTKTMLDSVAAIQLEFGCTIILIHHTGVSDDAQHRARGSSAWKGALDIEISIVPAKNDGPISIIQRKSKDTEAAENIHVDLLSIPIKGWLDEDNEPVTSAVITKGEAPIKVEKVTPIQRHMKLFDLVWCNTGMDSKLNSDHVEVPFVSRSGMKRELESMMSDGNPRYTDRTITNMMNNGEPNKMIGMLVAGQIITPDLDGWLVADRIQINAMMIRKNAR